MLAQLEGSSKESGAAVRTARAAGRARRISFGKIGALTGGHRPLAVSTTLTSVQATVHYCDVLASLDHDPTDPIGG